MKWIQNKDDCPNYTIPRAVPIYNIIINTKDNELIIEFNISTINLVELYSFIRINIDCPDINIQNIHLEIYQNNIKLIRDLNQLRTLTFLGFEYWFNGFFYNYSRNTDTKYIAEFAVVSTKVVITAYQNSKSFITTIPDKKELLNIIIREIVDKYS